MEKGQKLLSLQALRGYAIVGVFLCHEHVLDVGGQWGVSVFFMLSGFLLVYKYYKSDILRCSVVNNFFFAVNRIKKLYPLHIVTMIMGTILELQYGIDNKMQFAIKIISNIFLIQAWVPKQGIYFSLNGVAWYLSTLAFLYFIFPYMIKIIQSYKTDSIAITSMITSFLFLVGGGKLFSVLNMDLTWSNYVFPVYRLLDFFIGCNLGYLFLNQKRKEKNIIKSNILEIVSLVMVIFSMLKFYNASMWYQYTILFVPSSISLVYIFADNKGMITKLLTNKVIIFIGNISPYIFLFHRLVINWLWFKYENVITDKATECIISFFITMVLSLLWKKIDNIRYLHQRGRNWFGF